MRDDDIWEWIDDPNDESFLVVLQFDSKDMFEALENKPDRYEGIILKNYDTPSMRRIGFLLGDKKTLEPKVAVEVDLSRIKGSALGRCRTPEERLIWAMYAYEGEYI